MNQRNTHQHRRGLTLIELLIAASIMAMVGAAMAALSFAVQQGWEYSQGHATAARHFMVASERINRAIRSAYANEDHPGVAVLETTIGAYTYPDTLIVWTPTGDPANPTGLPLVSECTIFACDPESPNRLLEITRPTDTRTIPLNDSLQTSSWRTTLEEFKTDEDSEIVVLTDLIRVASIREGVTDVSITLDFPDDRPPLEGARILSNLSNLRPAIMFHRRLRPTDADLAEYRAGDTDWEDLPWPQGLCGSNSAMRQTWIWYEIQMMPGEIALERRGTGAGAIEFPGSASLLYEIEK